MNIWRALALSAVVGLCISMSAKAAQPQGPTFRAGAATSNITPPLNLKILGSFDPQPSKDIHDELHARCLVLDDGKKRVALVVCDLIGFHALVSQEARKLI